MTGLRPQVREHAAEVVGAMDDCLLPLAEASILPGEAYTSEDFFAFEVEALFRREWLCVGHVGQIPEAGRFFTLTVVGEPLIVVRDGTGTVRVLSAVCQHRGHPIFDGLGTPDEDVCAAARFTCPYHHWVYGLGGELLAAPDMHATTPVARLKAEIRLPEVRSEVFHGMIFVTFDDDAAPLAPTLAALGADLEAYRSDGLVAMPPIDRVDLPWNWKIHHENALEPYHTSYVHADVHGEAPADLARFLPFEPGQGMIWHPTYLVSEGASLNTFSGDAELPPIEGLDDDQRRRIMFSSVPPTLFLIQSPTMLDMSLLLPQGAGRLTVRRINLYPRAAVEHPAFAAIYAEQREKKSIAIEQDRQTASAVQRGYASTFAPRGRMAALEETVHQLHEWLVPRYRAALEAGVPVEVGS